MPSSFPAAYDALTNPTPTDPLASSTVPHATQHTNLNDIIEAIEAKLGLGAGGAVAGTVLKAGGIGVSTWGKVTAAELADNAVTGGNLAPGSVTGAASGVSGHLALNTITGSNILNNSITPDKIQANSIGAGQIGIDTINQYNIAADAITSSELAANAVGPTEIQDGAILTRHIGLGQVGSAQIADGSVLYADIGNGQIGTVHLGDSVVDSSKILDRSIISGDIALGAVTSNEIAQAAVTTSKIAVGAVSVAVSGQSGAAFSITNLASWTYDNASLMLVVPMADTGVVHVLFQGSFQSTVAGSNARFGIIRYGIDTSPVWPVVVTFPNANKPTPVALHLQIPVGPGSWSYTLAVQCATADFTLSWSADGNRSMHAFGLMR
jgi:hypothetical protein